ncbi:MAG: bifunctional sulfate adenylyltransferase/adenylylsulfate kinase [Alphaproteobacteria bacterium]|nr:bifunctional sulfate adenylyltransferase/adenylylsulfate kinase [Alphaproteobacteria bacterium]
MEPIRDLYLPAEDRPAAQSEAKDLRSWDLTDRQICDIELLLNGAFSPLSGFLGQEDYLSVCASMRLASGELWPIPITLDVSAEFGEQTAEGETIALRDAEGVLIALLEVSDNWQPDKAKEAELVFATNDQSHPSVHYLHNVAGPTYLGGRLRGVEAPVHYDLAQHRNTPNELRALFAKWGWYKVVGFHTRAPIFSAQRDLVLNAAKQVQANVLLQPAVGLTEPGDIDHFTRLQCYSAMLESFPEQTTFLSLSPMAMRLAGPREAVWHALIHKNYGCTHFLTGADHGSPRAAAGADPFYGATQAHDLLKDVAGDLGIELVVSPRLEYSEQRAQYLPQDELPAGETGQDIAFTELRRRLQEGLEIPEWFSPPEIIEHLRRKYPPRHEQGFTVFFTGLSGSGKSTVANALQVKLMEMGDRPVTLLDGDVVRKNLSSELTFSKEHRDLNILRLGFVAAEITKNGGIAICAPIAPYSATRRKVRDLIEPLGTFVEIHVSTPIEVCEERDRKGLYAKARAGLLKGFTGIDDPYEEPANPELRIATVEISPDEAAHQVLLKLESLGLIR